MEEHSNEYKPLYLKYRPQSLDELVGQKSVVKTLANALENNKIAHAYLFTGPRGTGKTSSARILAKSINCDNGPTVTPCLECSSCEAITNSSSPSVFEIDAASNNSVDDARALIERAPLATQDGKHKLYIIDECHMLTKEAFNALLKTIEEPPPSVVFILATTEEHKVPPTILSRCQRLMFRLVRHGELHEHLTSVAQKEEINITSDALDLMTRRSGGGLRDALGLLDQASLLARPEESVEAQDLLVLLGALDEEVLLNISEGIKELDGHKVLININQLLLDGREPSLIASELAKHFLALTKGAYLSSSEENSQFITGSKSYVDKVVEQAKGFDKSELSQIVEMLGELEIRIKRSSQPSLTLEMGILSICHRIDLASIKLLSDKVKKLEALIENGDFEQTRKPQLARAPLSKPKTAQPESRPDSPPPERVQTEPAQPEPQKSEPVKEEKPRQDFESEKEPVESPQQNDPVENEPVDDDMAPAADISELEELWSDLLDAVHKRSIPAYSLVKTHANPLSLENNQLTLGVSKEFFQKSIESKAGHVQEAYKSLTGNEITVKVKIVQLEELSKKKSEPKRSGNVGISASENRVQPPPAADKPENGNGRPREPLKEEAPPAKQNQVKSNDNNLNSEVRVKVDSLPDPQEESTLVNEAYRIFEGPGSRIIG